MIEPPIFQALAKLFSYPDERTIEASELVYVALRDDLPEAARALSQFGAIVEQCSLSELEEAFTATFDVNPACALEVGWHLFGEEYARGQFLVRMREEMRRYGIAESRELPDHITHVLAVIAAMPQVAADRFVAACVLPAVARMRSALEGGTSPYRHVVACLAALLEHQWGRGFEAARHELVPTGAQNGDLLRAFPVADVSFGCTGCCGEMEAAELIPLNLVSAERSDER